MTYVVFVENPYRIHEAVEEKEKLGWKLRDIKFFGKNKDKPKSFLIFDDSVDNK